MTSHISTALVRVYENRPEARNALTELHYEEEPYIDQTQLYGARPPPSERRENDESRCPDTPHPHPVLGTVPTSPVSTRSNLETPNPSEVDENEPPHNADPLPLPAYEPVEGMDRIPLRQLTTSPTSSFQPSPESAVLDLVSTDSGIAVARLRRHRDGSTTFLPPPDQA
ncbi:hypothetical protein EVJ58_g5592 [Rhodofomes roseus]|uniref:Uncharacterized protein n=1 Tax=Rhodofomes roseus TaxID=34475 RepID=A0A4Y9YFR3_9APHY|nr:hypothetical protein EVJ58_g5592 [Rhodofomes roseus]